MPFMRKRAVLILIAVALVAVALVAYVLVRRSSPPRAITLLPPADAYIFLDFASVRKAAIFRDLPKVELDPEYAEFVKQTGFQFERDLDEAAFAVHQPDPADVKPGQAPEKRYSEVFVATFNRGKVEAYLKKLAATTETYRDTVVYVIPLPGRTVRAAVLDKRTIAASNTDGPYVIQGMIDRHSEFSARVPEIVGKYYDKLPWGSVAWTVARTSTGAGQPASLPLPGGFDLIFPPDTVIVGSLRYLGSIQLKAQAFAASEDGARKITDQLSAFLALFRTIEGAQARGGDKDVKEFFDSIHLTVDGTRAELEATVPGSFVKKIASGATGKQ